MTNDNGKRDKAFGNAGNDQLLGNGDLLHCGKGGSDLTASFGPGADTLRSCEGIIGG